MKTYTSEEVKQIIIDVLFENVKILWREYPNYVFKFTDINREITLSKTEFFSDKDNIDFFKMLVNKDIF